MAKVSSSVASRCLHCNHLDLYLFEDASIDQSCADFSFFSFMGKIQTRLAWRLAGLVFPIWLFALMHTIRDRQSGRLPAVTLAEYVNYVIFFPSFTAGPIDRLERFVKDLRTPLPLGDEDWIDAGRGSLSVSLKNLSWLIYWPSSPSAMCLYRRLKAQAGCGSSFMPILSRSILILADIPTLRSGWDDCLAFRLPENFAAPYLKPNLTQFWNSWHMTLTQWFRSYFFNPLTRALRSGKRQLPVWIIIFVTQISTMILIGLWHGGTLNFVLWGAWHGFGLVHP